MVVNDMGCFVVFERKINVHLSYCLHGWVFNELVYCLFSCKLVKLENEATEINN